MHGQRGSMPYGSKDRRDSLGSMPRRNKRQRNSLSSMQATALTRPALPTCRQSQTRLRIIVHFVPRRPKRTIIRTRHDQCQPTADHARSIASNKVHSPCASSITRSPSAEAKAPPTVRPTAPLHTSRKGNCLDNGATEQVFGHLKDTDNGNRAIDEGYQRKCA